MVKSKFLKASSGVMFESFKANLAVFTVSDKTTFKLSSSERNFTAVSRLLPSVRARSMRLSEPLNATFSVFPAISMDGSFGINN